MGRELEPEEGAVEWLPIDPLGRRKESSVQRAFYQVLHEFNFALYKVDPSTKKPRGVQEKQRDLVEAITRKRDLQGENATAEQEESIKDAFLELTKTTHNYLNQQRRERLNQARITFKIAIITLFIGICL